ncbi:MAG: hypothetical protein ACREAM_23820 [Blastocatellia bacterium]
MNEDQKTDSSPKPMPAPQLPNIPISPDDPFQSDPDLLPPITPPPADPDPASSRQSPGRLPSQTPRHSDPDVPENDPDDPEAA